MDYYYYYSSLPLRLEERLKCKVRSRCIHALASYVKYIYIYINTINEHINNVIGAHL